MATWRGEYDFELTYVEGTCGVLPVDYGLPEAIVTVPEKCTLTEPEVTSSDGCFVHRELQCWEEEPDIWSAVSGTAAQQGERVFIDTVVTFYPQPSLDRHGCTEAYAVTGVRK